ncbi:MAG: ribose-phosphate pyrophosphokinase [Christensenellales bacterium]|jgi:ribose-phosphate pyrophosphokinase
MTEINLDSLSDISLLTLPVAPVGIIALTSSQEIGQRVNDYLLHWRDDQDNTNDFYYTVPGFNRHTFLLDAECPRFGTGEAKGILRQSIRGYDLYIIVDVGNYGVTYNIYNQEIPMTPDEHFADLKRIIAAASGKARRVNVIMPLLYASRQHRRSSRESLDCALALQELERMGIDNIITFDAHDPRVQNAVPMLSFESIRPSYQILKALFKEKEDLKLHKDHMMVVSPDEGGLDRNIYFATMLGLDMGMFYKRRDYTRVVNGRNPIIAHEYIGSSVEGKDILIADDIISSGESMLDIARELKRRKAARIFVGVTFAFFTSGLDEFKEAYEEGIIDLVLSTNVTYRTPELLAQPWFVDVDLSKYIALIIATLNHNRSMSPLLSPVDRINRLLKRYRKAQKEAGFIY